MTLAIPDKWVWDSWYAHDGRQWHGYFLQADKSLANPALRHWHVTQGHATSDDLVSWDYLGTCFAPSEKPAWDDYTTWTGSVVQDPQNLWHLFYTGTSHSENGLYQRIGHATSSDMHNWTRVNDGLCLDLHGLHASEYESEHMINHWHDRAMRDPWVMKNPGGDDWLMFFTARASGITEANAAGVIGFATSTDLYNWTLQAPVYCGGFGQLEVPQVFTLNGRWYCLFCTAAEHWSTQFCNTSEVSPRTGNHYLIGDSPAGPWRLPEAPFLDGALPAYRYAARVVDEHTQPKLIGFLDQGDANFGGLLLDPVPLRCKADGTLVLGSIEF